jgi:hypothetical protein
MRLRRPLGDGRDTRNNESQLGGGRYATPGEGVVVQCTSPRLPPFYWHGRKMQRLGARAER